MAAWSLGLEGLCQLCTIYAIERTLTSHEVAHLLGVNIKTIQRWDREGRLKPAGRTATGRRYYTEDQIRAFRQQRPVSPRLRKIVAYC